MYRKGTGQEWDLRMQLDYKAGRGSGKRGGRQEYADQGGWNERSSRKRSGLWFVVLLCVCVCVCVCFHVITVTLS